MRKSSLELTACKYSLKKDWQQHPALHFQDQVEICKLACLRRYSFQLHLAGYLMIHKDTKEKQPWSNHHLEDTTLVNLKVSPNLIIVVSSLFPWIFIRMLCSSKSDRGARQIWIFTHLFHTATLQLCNSARRIPGRNSFQCQTFSHHSWLSPFKNLLWHRIDHISIGTASSLANILRGELS